MKINELILQLQELSKQGNQELFFRGEGSFSEKLIFDYDSKHDIYFCFGDDKHALITKTTNPPQG